MLEESLQSVLEGAGRSRKRARETRGVFRAEPSHN